MSQPEIEPSGNDASAQQGERGYRVRAGAFEGPLDLLLHLVRSNEIDIADIPIAEITEQYNSYLEMMRDLNLEIAGEFLMMAATLMHIKSRMLLPVDPDAANEDGEDDPRAELVQQLLEYQRFKQAAENLSAMDSRRNLIWTRDRISADFEGEELLAVELFDLIKAFQSMLGRLGEEARLQLRKDTVSVAEKINWMTELLERRGSIDLLSLLEDLPTQLDRIATFLALLEMIRLQVALVFQRKLFGEIRIALVQESEDDEDRTASPPGAAEGEPA